MANAARVGDATEHGAQLAGAGSPDVEIAGKPAWRAIPPGVGAGLEEASKAIKALMDRPLFTPPEVAPKIPQIQAKLVESATAAAQSGNPSAPGGVASAFGPFAGILAAATAAYTAGAAVPGGEPGARAAFTNAIKATIASAAAAAVTAIAGPWDMHTCPVAAPAPHGPGLVTVGSETVLIDGFPAARQGDKVFEAAGGPDGVSKGCDSVEIG